MITAINDEPVRTIDDYFNAVRGSPDEMAYTLLNSRTGKLQGMVCTLDRPAAPSPTPNPPGATTGPSGFTAMTTRMGASSSGRPARGARRPDSDSSAVT